MRCTDNITAPDWSHTQLPSIIDSVFVLISAFQRKFLSKCPDGKSVCKELRDSFQFDLPEVLRHPVAYNLTPVRVEEFYEARREVNFTLQGELLLDDDSAQTDVSVVTTQLNLSKVCTILLPRTMCMRATCRQESRKQICKDTCSNFFFLLFVAEFWGIALNLIPSLKVICMAKSSQVKCYV